jgi:hypothetical protein
MKNLTIEQITQEVKGYQKVISSSKGYCKHYLIGRMEALLCIAYHYYGVNILPDYELQSY